MRSTGCVTVPDMIDAMRSTLVSCVPNSNGSLCTPISKPVCKRPSLGILPTAPGGNPPKPPPKPAIAPKASKNSVRVAQAGQLKFGKR